MVIDARCRSRLLLPLVGGCALALLVTGPAASRASLPQSRGVTGGAVTLPAEITDSVVNWCRDQDPAYTGFTLGSYQRQIDVDHVALGVCDAPSQPNQDPQSNQVTFGAANPVLAVLGPLPAARSGGLLDYGTQGHPVGSWSMPIAALSPAMRLDYTYQQTSCGSGGGACSTGTFPLANLYKDDDPLRSRRLRTAGWAEQDAPNGRVEPLFSARCESGCASTPVSLMISIILLQKQGDPFNGAPVIDLGPYPVSLSDATTLRFRLPVPLAVQRRIATFLNGSATRLAVFAIGATVQKPFYLALSGLAVSARSVFGSSSYSPYQPAAVRLEDSSFRADDHLLAPPTPRWALSAVKAKPAKESLTVVTSRPGLDNKSLLVKASGHATSKKVTVTVHLEEAAGTKGRYASIGKTVKVVLPVKRGAFHVTLRLPTPLTSGVVVRAVVKSVGKTAITRKTLPATLLRAW